MGSHHYFDITTIITTEHSRQQFIGKLKLKKVTSDDFSAADQQKKQNELVNTHTRSTIYTHWDVRKNQIFLILFVLFVLFILIS